MNGNSRHYLETLLAYGGIYERKIGDPLVGYKNKYSTPEGEERQFVGGSYVNLTEVDSDIICHFAEGVGERIAPIMHKIDFFCGAPSGGYRFADMLGLFYHRDVIKAESAFFELRRETEITFDHYQIERGASYAIVDDVCSNFMAQLQIAQVITKLGGKISAIVCFLNKSLDFSSFYPAKTFYPLKTADDYGIRVISLVRKPSAEYRQDNPRVVDDVTRGNVVWNPKKEWPRLMEIMKREAV